jgi:hypothetical protein
MLQSEGREVVFHCENCGRGYALEQGELRPAVTEFAVAKLQEPGQQVEYQPFWVLRAVVDVRSRSAGGGFMSAIRGSGGPTEGEVDFYIPAFEAPLETLKQIAMHFTESQPEYEKTDGRGRALRGCVHSEEFARGFADFVLLSLEAEKPDTMRSIEYTLDFKGSSILAVPFVSLDGRKKDLISGKETSGW